MDPEHNSQLRVVKVGILGDKKAGKTYLARKLTGKSEVEQSQTTEPMSYASQGSQFVYIESPTFNNQTIIDIATSGHYDILLFIFKECQSFTKLYEFLVSVSEVIQQSNNRQVKFYWQHLKKVIFIYTDFESQLPVQLDQLFPILEEEVSNFCKGVTTKTFVINKTAQHYDQLKNIIEEEPIHIQFENQDVQEEKNHEQIVEISQQPILQIREVALSGEEKEEGVSVSYQQDIPEDGPHPVHQLQVQHEELNASKINEEKKSEIYKKIQKSFFVSEVLEHESDEGVPNAYQNIDIRASTNILQEFSRPLQSELQREIQLDKEINRYNQEKKQKMEESMDISEGDLPPKIVQASNLSVGHHQHPKQEQQLKVRSQQYMKKAQKNQQLLKIQRKPEYKEDEVQKMLRQKEEEQLYRQAVKEEQQKQRQQKQQKEEKQEAKDQKSILKQQQINKELTDELQLEENTIKKAQQEEGKLQRDIAPVQVNETYIQQHLNKQEAIQNNNSIPQEKLKILMESHPEPQLVQSSQQDIVQRPKPKMELQKNQKIQEKQADQEPKCKCLIM